MPLLIVVLAAPLLVFLALVAAADLAIRCEARRERRRRESMEWRARERIAHHHAPRRAEYSWPIAANSAFDTERAPLWETQVPALQLISGAGRQGVLKASLAPQFERDARRYPELYDGASFDAWLQFVERAGLAAVHDGVAHITHRGREFLLFQEQRHWTRHS